MSPSTRSSTYKTHSCIIISRKAINNDEHTTVSGLTSGITKIQEYISQAKGIVQSYIANIKKTICEEQEEKHLLVEETNVDSTRSIMYAEEVKSEYKAKICEANNEILSLYSMIDTLIQLSAKASTQIKAHQANDEQRNAKSAQINGKVRVRIVVMIICLVLLALLYYGINSQHTQIFNN